MSEREQFEAAYRQRHNVPDGVSVDFPDVPHAWIWWQASRRVALEHCADVITNVIAHGGDMNAALGLIRALAASDSDGGKS